MTATYSIYTFEKTAPAARRHPKWRWHDALEDLPQALSRAEDLYGTGKFQRVEVKTLRFDPRRMRTVDSTLKVFGHRHRKLKQRLLVLTLALLSAGLVDLLLH